MSHNGSTKKTPALSPRQEAALPVIAAAPTIAQAARLSKIGRRTLHRWLEDPDFRAQYAQQQRESAELAKGHLQSLALQAALQLGEVLDDPNPELRLRAARTILSFSAKFGDIQEIQAQVQALESSIPLWKAQEKAR